MSVLRMHFNAFGLLQHVLLKWWQAVMQAVVVDALTEEVARFATSDTLLYTAHCHGDVL